MSLVIKVSLGGLNIRDLTQSESEKSSNNIGKHDRSKMDSGSFIFQLSAGNTVKQIMTDLWA